MTKPTEWVCTQQRLRSAWASTQSVQSLHCALNRYLRTQAFFMWTAKTLIRLGGGPGWSESSLGARPHCWFCHEAAHFMMKRTATFATPNLTPLHSSTPLQNSVPRLHCIEYTVPLKCNNSLQLKSLGAYQLISQNTTKPWSVCSWVCMGGQGPKASSHVQLRLWSECTDAQADLSSLEANVTLPVL